MAHAAATMPQEHSHERERTPRDLNVAEQKIRTWVRRNHGVLSRVAREMGCSVTFVQRVAYNREARSEGQRIERRLRSLGCPLMQKIA